jgi:hypothetical protein
MHGQNRAVGYSLLVGPSNHPAPVTEARLLFFPAIHLPVRPEL